MDLTLLVGVAISLLIVIITVFLFKKKSKSDDGSKRATEGSSVDSSNSGNLRRAQIARNQRNRLRNGAPVSRTTPATNENVDEHSAAPSSSAAISDEKLGAKKRAKLEAKAEKRIQREAELKSREDRKLQENILEEERRKLEEKEAEEERKRGEIERLEREERERKELEEYLKMKEAFSVEEEGYEEGDDSEKENLLADFIHYIKNNKVVILEDLAIQFKLKTQQAIDRITELQANGTLTGVIDDRGKFIYISEDELKAVANFIRQRGRVSITELAESSNVLINLIPVE